MGGFIRDHLQIIVRVHLRVGGEGELLVSGWRVAEQFVDLANLCPNYRRPRSDRKRLLPVVREDRLAGVLQRRSQHGLGSVAGGRVGKGHDIGPRLGTGDVNPQTAGAVIGVSIRWIGAPSVVFAVVLQHRCESTNEHRAIHAGNDSAVHQSLFERMEPGIAGLGRVAGGHGSPSCVLSHGSLARGDSARAARRRSLVQPTCAP